MTVKIIAANNSSNIQSYKDPFFSPFVRTANELSVENGILMWGYRVVFPKILQSHLLNQLHQSHLGIVKAKSICRFYFWWPKICDDIKKLIKSYETCHHTLSSPSKNYSGPFKNLYFLVIIDAHSKWIKVFPSNTMSTDFTILKLREFFARYGLPREVISIKIITMGQTNFGSTRTSC